MLFPEKYGGALLLAEYLTVNGRKYSVIGNASNLLFLDEGYSADDRILIFIGSAKSISFSDNICTAECGASLTALALKCSKSGLCGLEFAYGIPGSVGGAVFMNAGAYGGEMSNVVRQVKYFDSADSKVKTINGDELDFSYRHSFFTGKNHVILSAVLELTPGNADESVRLCEENMAKRCAKQPLKLPSCGVRSNAPRDTLPVRSSNSAA